MKSYHEVTSGGVESVFMFEKVVPMTSRGILKMGWLIIYMSHFHDIVSARSTVLCAELMDKHFKLRIFFHITKYKVQLVLELVKICTE